MYVVKISVLIRYKMHSYWSTVTLNRHLTVMKIHTDPMCPRCGEEEETTYHFLGKCTMMMAHYWIPSLGDQ